MADIDPRELERRLLKLERQMEQVLEAVRKREDDLGTIRSNAAKVQPLIEELREVKRLVGRGGDGRTMTAVAPVPPPAPVMAQTGAPVDVKQVIRGVAGELLQKGQLPTLDDLKRIVKEEIGTQLRTLVNMDALTERIWKEITATGVEERLAKLLLDRVGREVDTKQVIRQLVEDILARINVESLVPQVTTGVAEKIAAGLELRRKGY